MMFLIALIHIIAGSVAVAAGTIAITTRKGRRLHRRSGRVFAISMLVTAAAGFALALINGQAITIVAGVLTAYLVTTAWLSVVPQTAWRNATSIGMTVLATLTSVAALVLGSVARNTPDGTWQNFAAGDYFFLAGITVLATAGDIYRFAADRPGRAARLARHLWRMCTGLFFAVGSLFTGPGATVFPEAVRDSGILSLPELSVFLIMLYWLLRAARRALPDKTP